ncbi:hypothetical protein JCM6882_008488 [Rhodosporidiobolus microsporus]
MTPTSPTTTSTTTRPPARNKSSSALSTQTIRSLSSTGSGGGGPPKPRRNKSSSALSAHGSHHHSAGHHPVSFAHHRKNSSHGLGPHHAMKRSGSVSGSARKGGGFGLGMTSMTSMPPAGGRSEDDDEGHEGAEHDEEDGHHQERPQRPQLAGRRSSSSSTATVVASERGRGRERSRSRAREEEEQQEREAQEENVRRRREEERDVETPVKPKPKNKDKERISGSVTSTNSDWASETDSPLAIGKKLPPVERAAQPEGHSGLAQAFGNGNGAVASEEDDAEEEVQRAPTPSRANGGKKAQFQLGASDEPEEEEEDDDEADELAGGEAVIPPAAMPPAETPILPAMPAVIEALTPAVSSEAVADQEKVEPSPEAIAAAAPSAVPPPTQSAQHLSPPAPDTGDGDVDVSPGEPSLAAAAQPEFAYPNQPPSPPASRPSSEQQPSRNKPPALSPHAPPAQPPTASRLNPSTAKEPPSPIRPTPQRVAPVRKSSDASIMSRASMRSHLTATHRAPQFRRTASGAAPVVVDRAATARAEMASPIPDGPEATRDEAQRRKVVGERPAHSRTESMGSMRSLRQAAEATTVPNRRANTLGPADAKRLRATETAGGALAALGNIAAMSNVKSPPGSGRGSGNGSEDEGALTHAKRSASGYFNALRGFTGLQSLSSTPPLSPSANAAQRYPIPGVTARDRSSSSYARGARARSSPSPVNPPLIVKFAEPPPPPPAPQPARPASPPSSAAVLSSSPAQGRLSAQSRTASSASLSHAPLSRTQQKALLARDAPSTASPAVGSHHPSAAPSPAPASQNGMQKWAFGLIKEAERIERQYRAVERWRDPMGEGLERVLGRAAERRVAEKIRRAGGVEGAEGGEVSLVVPPGQVKGKQRALTAA